MKRINHFLIAIATVMFTVTGCEDDFLDVNTNPNRPTVSTPDLVLPSALYTSVKRVNVELNVLGNLWAGNWTQATDFLFYGTQLSYGVNPSTYNGIYNEIFNQSLNDLKYIETEATKSGDANYVAIAKIMKGYNYLLLVDLWGDVPFDDALQGTNILTPKYEDDAIVYDKALASIDAGIAAIDADGETPGDDDIYFHGDMEAWHKFANTLKLRAYLRMSAVNATKAKQGVESITGGFIGADETVFANPGFLKSTNKMNPFYATYGYSVADAIVSNNKATRAADFGMNFLKNNNDPRLARLYNKPTGDDYKNEFRSIPTGTRETQPNKTFLALSGIGPGIIDDPGNDDDNENADDFGFAKSIVVFSSAESLFLQAEAVQRGWLSGDAKALYESAITENFKLLGVGATEAASAAAAATYYGQAINNVGWNASTDKIEAIITQKWVALNGINGIEAWNEYRRTGFPTGMPISVTALTPKYPIRIPYAQDEFANNGDNVPPASTVFDLPVFWDAN
ncbi:SusD/RagB family nutrient-binding outer membrane lipoprotein [Fulvivirgaceae bacterium PWU4]|uniref:SusD/RagB family nutrient-binding outer membrane lipoprotein n=1 Tax=Chryseosolibacter histidini TaxID=2782349 RepID=A0AAP2DP19_9BACT|nr:SusD/RagB family nutrient-binding outer membrane lipoprotein [Chryseosolibacter histidini]MBT1699931.1 SusD/RagB family nutrient-binding outer membrane lipoprotein [Chryseosolibacter histidini]